MILDFSGNINIKSLSPQNQFEEKVVSFLEEWLSPTGTVSVQTSGSTGTPKLFSVEKARMRNSAKMTCDFLDLKPNSSALLCLPVEYISGKMMMVRAIERKLKLIIKEPSTRPLADFNETIQFCAMTPLQVENSLNQIHHIQNLIIGGAQVPEILKKEIFTQMPVGQINSRIYETYGMSETLSHIALKQIYPANEANFTVLNDVQIDVDERGCLMVFAPQLNTENLQTNDLVQIKNKSQFRFLGRVDNIINSGGIKINPELLEEVLKMHLPNDVIFSGLDDRSLGQKLVLAVEGDKSLKLSSQINASLNAVETSFSKNHRPREIYYLKEFPRLPNGKINRLGINGLINQAIIS